MAKLNCWEFMKCERGPGGALVTERGVCPASVETRVNGANGGLNGGRVCWAITSTLCGGKVQGDFSRKVLNCMGCKFYQLVGVEEGSDRETTRDVLNRLKAHGAKH